MKNLLLLTFFLFVSAAKAQLTIEKIMADPKHSVGALPSNIQWSEDSKTIYFNWNPELHKADSLYAASVADKKPVKVSPEMRRILPSPFGDSNRERTQKVYAKNGDIYVLDVKTMNARQIVNTVDGESNPYFNQKGDKILFTKANNLFSVHLENGVWNN